MLDIFFSNKIASTSDNWTDELILIASIFNQFDGLPYSRSDIDAAFETISTRVPDARDASDYRDEYGAYGSFLGLVNYEAVGNSWVCRTTAQAKEFLCGILPDPQSFIRLQMSLFQYPNPVGGAFNENGKLRIEHSS